MKGARASAPIGALMLWSRMMTVRFVRINRQPNTDLDAPPNVH